ncbi:MAG: cytidine/deoxycytidylate deaminase family protein [Bdellovibrionales bacterium]|nr:cytidine/deoxycytidylate deaminase family protein [Bdellovibrionales bacterium]
MGNDLQSETNGRPSWDEYFLQMSEIVATRATCDRGRAGSVIVKDRRVLATGYVGSPPGLPHCDEVGHLMKQVTDEDETVRRHCVRTIHAEQNAICQAARYGIPIEGATLYCKMEPCRVCAMLIISVGIRRVVCRRLYHAGADTRSLFAQAGVLLEVLDEEIEQYSDQ